MSILISCAVPPFRAQKARKRIFPVGINLSLLSGISDTADYFLRVTLQSGGPVFSLPGIPSVWNAKSSTIVETGFFNPHQIADFIAFPAFMDSSNPTVPTSGYSATFEVDLIHRTTGSAGSPVQFVLSGSADAAQSVDVVFSLDHGSTMNITDDAGRMRLDRLKAAFSRGVALLRSDDMLGVATFSNFFTPTGSQDSAGATTARQDAATTMANALAVDGVRPLRKSIQQGIDIARVIKPTANVVLITDGMNYPGYPLATPTLPTSALIISEPNNQISAAAAAAMVSSDGEYLFASANALGEFAVEKLLTQLVIGIGGSSFISDPEGSLKPGGHMSFPLQITEADRELEVIVYANDAAPLNVQVLDVRGNEPSDSHCVRHWPDGKPPDDPCRGPGYVITRVAIPAAWPQDHLANPQVVVSRGLAPNDGEAEAVRFNLLVVAKTDLVLDAKFTASGLTVGSDLLLSAVLTEYGQVWHRNHVRVVVELTHPDGAMQKITLEECAPGRFQASLRSFRAGVYTAHFIATSQSLFRHRPFRRECLRTVIVSPPRDCCPEPRDPCAFSRD